MNLLHIIDDKKFIEACQRTFRISGITNFYLRSGLISAEYLKEQQIDIIFIHFLRDQEVAFLLKHKIHIPIIWMFWGADGFSLPSFYNAFIGNKTKIYLRKWYFKNHFYSLIRDFVKEYGRSVFNHRKAVSQKLRVIQQFSYIVPVIPDDYNILKNKYPSVNNVCYHFNYITPIFFKDFQSVPFVSGKNILLGNSSSNTNNHIEVLEILTQVGLKSRQVIIPLNYGDLQYKKAILEYLQKINTFQVQALTDFMEFSEYQTIIHSCEIMIMNHYRQQALGNIIMGLLTGVTIYLSERSPIFNFLIKNGFIVHTVESIKSTGLIILKEDDKQNNKEKCIKTFGPDRQTSKITRLLKTIEEQKHK
ncbi:TDP-N-acetylfucosamine:lipid II N-acetylfucosaminyltransferase [Niabella aurantiaca]|uniref:TDP-N-acetylfucosamine:lipid II N-acetylfucosaminyltransferase n=1 Tax=Niabella aurantiaca TaxID=379900 RepID=UPI00037A5F8A|nr:TDP-N-acetylfucosamine:lipid II N-acetylfucosaminyltransferase [Niabella aurantiaca]